MRPRQTVAVLTVLALMVLGPPVGAQSDDSPEAVVLVLDASGSMLEGDGQGGTKIDTAKAALRTLIDELPEGQQVGLRVYGHRVPSRQKAEACQDTEAIAPVGALDRDRLRSAVDSFQALGETPIGLSLQQAAADLPGDTAGAIVLVSDGLDECFPELGPEPCQVARDLAATGVELRIESVGLQVDDTARAQLQCIADATGGIYVDVADASRLADELLAAEVRARRSFETRGTPVEGGPSIIDATSLGDGVGTWTDTILEGETLWYAIEAEPGSEVRVEATIDPSQNTERGGNFEIELSPGDGGSLDRSYETGTGAEVTTVSIGDTVPEGDDAVYLSIHVQHFAAEIEYPVVWTVEVDPPEEEEPASETEATATTEVATDDAAAELAVDAGDDSDPALTVPGVLLGLVVGAALGAGTVTLLRRRSEPTD